LKEDAMTMVEELERLSALRDKGAISDAEYEQAKARILSAMASTTTPVRVRRTGGPTLRRSASDRWLGGVCGGIAQATDTETWIWRLVFTAGLVFGGVTAVIYLLLWIFVPPQESDLPG
jgi:phage shock protein C